MNLPNKLTMARMIAVPFFIAFYMVGWYIPAFVLFILASLTDMLDGRIARKRGLVTNFGKIMDPLADKILVYSAFCLMVPDPVPAWMLIIILAREFLVAGMRTVAAADGKVIAAGFSGKLKTVLQMVAVILLLLLPAWPAAWSSGWLEVLSQVFLWASLVMTVYSGVEYMVRNREVFSMR